MTAQRYNFQTGKFEPAPYVWGADCEHDDYMTAEDYDRRAAMRDGWVSDTDARY